ncbi:MAG: NAD(+)/NADH kinase [Tissierellia bacterium]|nr:NAD(+)/NADH kinase [Tissierellia bacterium]
MKKKLINVVSNTNYETRKVRSDLIDKLNERGYSISKGFDHDAELTISIGGDGAFLKAVHNNRFPKMPIMGINTGTLGFFQEISPEDMDKFLDKYDSGDYRIEEISMVKGEIYTKNRKFTVHAVNEIILKGKNSKVIQMDVLIDGNHLQSFAGDGIMVSSPVGSTAYNFSLGGSIVYTTLHSLQLTPIAPLNSTAYRSLKSSLIVPGSTRIMLDPPPRYKNSSLLVVDGEEMEYWDLEKVELTMSNKWIKRLLFNKDFYWHNLKDKFL